MVSDQIIKVLDNLCDKFGLAIDWSSKNVQPYLEELITKCVNYKFTIGIIWLCVAALLLITGVILLIFAFKTKNSHKTYNYWDDMEIGLAIFSVVAFIFCVLICLFTIPQIVACKTFPEKIILDMIQSYLQ